MNNKFDELAKGLAQSVTRRVALKKFGAGLASVVMVSLGLANKAQANPKCAPYGYPCKVHMPHKCCSGVCWSSPDSNITYCL